MNAAVCLGLPSIANLISRMPGGIAQGIIWGIMALGLYITFRLLDIADLTVDGSFATGGAVAIMLITSGCPAWAALIAALLAGLLQGYAQECCTHGLVFPPYFPAYSPSLRCTPSTFA